MSLALTFAGALCLISAGFILTDRPGLFGLALAAGLGFGGTWLIGEAQDRRWKAAIEEVISDRPELKRPAKGNAI